MNNVKILNNIKKYMSTFYTKFLDMRLAAATTHDHPEVVHSAIQAEVHAGRLVPVTHPVHTSPMGLVSKSSSRPGEIRLILDLSSPKGHASNDGIDPELCSLKYSTIDQAILLFQVAGSHRHCHGGQDTEAYFVRTISQ